MDLLIYLFSLLALSIQNVSAFWRVRCAPSNGAYRVDTIVSPGTLSAHSHRFFGSGFIGMSTKFQDLEQSCTSCEVSQDKSAYWAPPLLFEHPNGTFENVPLYDGILVYYNMRGSDLKAFPEGFKMVTGDANRRNWSLPYPVPPTSFWTAEDKSQSALAQKAIGFNCLHYRREGENFVARNVMPEKDFIDATCKDGLRLELVFPSCWDGINLDSPDHKSHVAFPDFVLTGECPPGYPVRLPTLFFEHSYRTSQYSDLPGRFVLSNGDPTGFGYHGDFMSGWNPGVLQKLINHPVCGSDFGTGLVQDCPLLKLKNWGNCKFDAPKVARAEKCGLPQKKICGNVRVQGGPGPAFAGSAFEPPLPVPARSPPPAPAPPPPENTPATTIVTSIYVPLPSARADVSYNTEYTTVGGKVYRLQVEEVTVTEVETVFVKRSIATQAVVIQKPHKHFHAAPHHRHGHGHSG